MRWTSLPWWCLLPHFTIVGFTKVKSLECHGCADGGALWWSLTRAFKSMKAENHSGGLRTCKIWAMYKIKKTTQIIWKTKVDYPKLNSCSDNKRKKERKYKQSIQHGTCCEWLSLVAQMCFVCLRIHLSICFATSSTGKSTSYWRPQIKLHWWMRAIT